MQKHVNLVDLVKSFPTNIYLQNLASIQKRTSAVKFAHLAEKSGKGSISSLSTKVASPRSRLAFCVSDQCRRVDFSRLSPHVQIVLTWDWPTRSPPKQVFEERRRINGVSNNQLTVSSNFIY